MRTSVTEMFTEHPSLKCSLLRCRNIAIMANDTKEDRRGSMRPREAGVQHVGGRQPQSRGRVSRQRSVRGLGSPPPKQTPPLNEDEWSAASRGRVKPRSASPAARSGHSVSPPPRRVSTPLYVIGSPPGHSQQVNFSLHING